MTDAENADMTHIYKPAPDQEQHRRRLYEIICRKSLITGEPITLTSGKISDYYFNTKPTMMDAEGSSLIASLMLDAIQDTQADLVGGLEMGAVPLAASITAVSHLQNRPVNAFFIRKQAKEHGTKSLIEGLSRNDNIADKRVVVVEDVTTTGSSAIKAAQALQAEKAIVTRVITIIDRQEGAAEAFANAGFSFMALFGGSEFRSQTS